MMIFLAVLMSVAALAAVAYPILARPRTPKPARSSAAETLEELLAARDAAFGALRDLSFDHRVGKIADEDFAVFEAHLKQVAAESLRALDAWEAAADGEIGGALLQGIASRRALIAGQGRACPNCGRLSSAQDKFCAACGASLPLVSQPPPEPGPLLCPECGRPFEPEDRFCAGCGQQLPAVAAVNG